MNMDGLCCMASQHIAAAAGTLTQRSATSSQISSWQSRPAIDISNPVAWSTGQSLRIGFLDGSDWQKQQVCQHAPEWCLYTNLTFAFDANPTPGVVYHILITFSQPGSWSKLGTQSLWQTVFGQPSMNFGWMRPDIPQADLRATILHEFGHALGLVHEHQRNRIDLAWDMQEACKFLRAPPYMWSDDTILYNIFNFFTGDGLLRKGFFDEDSIMLYTFPRGLFRDFEGTKKNVELSLFDKATVYVQYWGKDMGQLRQKIHINLDGVVHKAGPTRYSPAQYVGVKGWEDEEAVTNDPWMNK